MGDEDLVGWCICSRGLRLKSLRRCLCASSEVGSSEGPRGGNFMQGFSFR